jgi:catechol 2,3-dioxygenase-like lactoylglutathione lyase family enzyme
MTMPSTPSTADASYPFPSWKIDHAAIRVPDFDAAVAWYTEKLDFHLKRSLPLAGLTFALLSPAADDSFGIELLAGPGADNRATFKDLHASYKLPGWHHVGFRVESVDHAIDELQRRGVTIVAEPQDVAAMGLRVAFISDPWDNIFEIVQSLSD